MRREHEVKIRLTSDEFAKLNRDVEKVGCSRERYLRALIMKKHVKERPSVDLISVLKNLQQINNNINQIAMKANSMNFVDTSAYWKNVEVLKQTINELLEVMYG